MEFPVLRHKANLTAQAHPGLPKDLLFTVRSFVQEAEAHAVQRLAQLNVSAPFACSQVPNLLSTEECQAVIDYAEGLGFSQQGSR
jgi:hypothetical protein